MFQTGIRPRRSTMDQIDIRRQFMGKGVYSNSDNYHISEDNGEVKD